jgi:hypothetical protein
MCIGGMKTSSPTVYKRPNPQDIYYNGNIYDPKPVEETKDETANVSEDSTSRKQSTTNNNPMNKSNTGLQIY